jgi:hypothetical protein
VTGIRPAVESRHDIELGGEQIDNFSFALIAELGSHYNFDSQAIIPDSTVYWAF